MNKNLTIKKIPKSMKLGILLFFLTFGLIQAENVYSQTAKITLSASNETVSTVLEKVEKQSEFTFIYDSNVVNVNRKVSVNVDNENIFSLLSQIFADTDIAYTVVNEKIILNKKEDVNIPQNEKKISGRVVDSDGEPVIGASVIILEAQLGTSTDLDGHYELSSIPSSAKTIEISFLGYKTIVIPINGRQTIDAILESDTELLEEVYVVGYGTVKKSDLTGSVSKINTEKIQKSTSTSITQSLQGQIPGLQVTQNSAQPGGGTSLLIRGAGSVNASNSPLIVVDGFPIGGVAGDVNMFYGSGNTDNGLNSINPNDIASIEVLKDASSTAIYGARAANGVIMITTKRGVEGKVKVSYDGSASMQKFAEVWDVLNAKDFMIQTNRVLKERWLHSNRVYPYGSTNESEVASPFTPRYTEEYINNYKESDATDWLDAVLRMGYIQQHNVGLSGGGKANKYMVSINVYDQNGIVKENGLTRLTARFNFDQEIGKMFKAGFSSSFTHTNTDNVQLNGGNGANSFGVLQLAIGGNPLIPVQNEDGTYPLDPNNNFSPNPASLLEVTDKSKFIREFVNTYLEFKPISDLLFRASFGYDGSTSLRNQYIPTTTKEGASRNGMASISNTKNDNLLFEAYGNYSKTIKKHSFEVMLGMSYQKFLYDGSYMMNTNTVFDSFKWYDIGSASGEPTLSSWGGSYNLISYYSRLKYNFNSKYLITANFRYDGSPKFSEKHRWGFFPSVSGSWVISNEEFFLPVKGAISELKLRAGYGMTGNDDIGNRTTDAYSVGRGFPFGSSKNNGAYVSQLGNNNLLWESTTDINVGLDFGFINGRISGSVDYYNRLTNNLLSSRNLPEYNEITSIPDNIGATRSSGVDISTNFRIIDRKFVWTATVNASYNRTRWEERGEFWTPNIYQNINDDMSSIFTYSYDRISKYGETIGWQPNLVPGGLIFRDIDGYKRDDSGNPITDENGRFVYLGEPDGKLDDADYNLIGTTQPKWNFGFTTNMSYKGFDLSIYMYAMTGFYKYNDTKYRYSYEAYRMMEGYNQFTEIKDCWSSDNTNGTNPNLILGLANTYGLGNYLYERADFLRLKNITLGYTFNPNKVFSKLRLYLSADNLFVITKYSGIDPETDSMGGYPNQRTFTFGLNITF